MRHWLLPIFLALPGPALALDWVLVDADSNITFTYTEDGREMSGSFPAFTGTAFYDPELPEGAEVEVSVTTDAVRMADPVRTLFAKSPAWFHTSEYPEALFRLTELEQITETELNAAGTLSVKDRQEQVAMPVTLIAEGGCLRASGELTIAIADYDIGDDAFSRFIQVGETVTLTFNLLGQRRGRNGPC
ncbi:MAG: YceI family protein [Pseudomonadota bacterium]